MKLKLEMELLSDSIPGSGESIAGYIDQDVTFDSLGIPYIPAKRIKGILRMSAEDLSDWGELQSDVNTIFGIEGDSKTVFNITNGYLKNYSNYYEFLNYIKLSSKDLSGLSDLFPLYLIYSYFSYNRTQTAVDREISISKEGSLRVFRVLKKGLKFEFIVTLKEDFQEDFQKICTITKHFGSTRTRGFGYIALRVTDISETSSLIDKKELPNYEDDHLCFIDLNVSNNEQILVSNLINGLQKSELFIRGSYLRGALAYHYIKQKNLDNPLQNPEFTTLFVSDNVIYSNLYPSLNDKIYYPTPNSVIKEKGKEKYYDLAFEDDRNTVLEISDTIQTVPVRSFTAIESSNLLSCSIPSKIESHHRRPLNRKIGHAKESEEGSEADLGNYFHFDVLEPDLTFKGSIIGTFKNLKPLIEILPKTMVLRFGKSISAQYGKCSLKVGDINKIAGPPHIDVSKRLIVTLRSDMILINEFGTITPDPEIFKKKFTQFLELKEDDIEIERCYLKFKKVGGFNYQWKFPKIQSQALAAGSVLILRLKGIETIKMSDKKPLAFGLRKSEGYGLIEINKHGSSGLIKRVHDDIHSPKKFSKDFEVPKDLINYCFKEEVKLLLRKNALELSKKRSVGVSRSFLQRFVIFLNTSDNINDLNTKLTNLKENALKKLEKIKKELCISKNQVNLEKFLEKLGNIYTDKFELNKIEDSAIENDIFSYFKEILDEKSSFLTNLGDIFTLYKIYSTSYLTNLILKSKVSE